MINNGEHSAPYRTFIAYTEGTTMEKRKGVHFVYVHKSYFFMLSHNLHKSILHGRIKGKSWKKVDKAHLVAKELLRNTYVHMY